MLRLSVLVLLATLSFAAAPARAAEPPAAVVPLPDLFTVSNLQVDATAESATQARDLAMAQGRPAAFTILFRRFTSATNWGREPQLDDNQILRLMRSFEVANERRSTTRYVANVTFHFNPATVRQLLRRANIAFTETRSPPVLLIPLSEGNPTFDPLSPWAMAWGDPALQQGLMPVILPEADIPELDALMRPDLTQVDWAALMPLAERYNVTQVVVAIASEDAKSVLVIEVSMMGRRAGSFAYAQSDFMADAAAVSERLAEAWKTRSAIDFGMRTRLVADVPFGSLDEWAKIRAQLAGVRAVADVEVVGLTTNEAQIGLTYFGRPEQLADAMMQQDLELSGTEQTYTLQLGGGMAAGE